MYYTTHSTCMHIMISLLSPEVMNLIRRDSVTGTPIVPKNLICSRLRTEFEEIEFLGKGGFGDVVKVGSDAEVIMQFIVHGVCISVCICVLCLCIIKRLL